MNLSQTEVDGIQEEMLTTEQYTIDMEIKFRKLKVFLEQQTQPKVRAALLLSLRETASIQVKNPQAEQPRPWLSQSTEQLRPWFSQSTSAWTQINANALPATSNIVRNDLHSHRLPKLTLPSFDGELQKWQTFLGLL
ncbi:hypothetical protein DPMN_094222 [Dreissena polymorpha]|uniref:Uncharacterized protein n=1 Tax=Dreissena polymorpha TaxID=45954 RepID=A0A9D4L4R6_DREPO|nr:hypothetical protein DPMN_094222 [Dreissena polymorpha]